MKIQDYLYSEFDSNIVEEFLMMLDIMEDSLDLTIERLQEDNSAINDLFRKINDELIDWLFKVADQFHQWYQDINQNAELSHINPQILKVPKI